MEVVQRRHVQVFKIFHVGGNVWCEVVRRDCFKHDIFCGEIHSTVSLLGHNSVRTNIPFLQSVERTTGPIFLGSTFLFVQGMQGQKPASHIFFANDKGILIPGLAPNADVIELWFSTI